MPSSEDAIRITLESAAGFQRQTELCLLARDGSRRNSRNRELKHTEVVTNLSHQSRRWTWVLLVALSSTLMSCAGGNAEKKEVYSVSGSLFINGEPAADAWITLAPDSDGVPIPMGRVEKDGSFQMSVYDQDMKKYPIPGDPAGEYHVLVRMPKDPSMPLSADRLGGAFADPTVFEHLVTIEVGENTLDPIRIDHAKIHN
jgi:hypothetical protein